MGRGQGRPWGCLSQDRRSTAGSKERAAAGDAGGNAACLRRRVRLEDLV